MPKNLSQTAKSIIIILNNINDLVKVSNRRKDAVEEMRALKTFVKQANFQIPEDKMDNFIRVIWDSRPNTIEYLILDLVQDVVKHN